MKFQLENSVYLEDAEVLLPWDASSEEIALLASSQVHTSHGRTEIFWSKQECLDGLLCWLGASFDHSPDKYSTNTSGLRMMNVVALSIDDETTFQGYKRVHEKFTSLFGPPTNKTVDQMNYPFSEWDLEEILLTHFIHDRFGPIVTTEIWRKPLPQWRAESDK
ncbi:hypothetical protein OAF98_02290 [Planctomicrobium sp.]|jgi:hypothetical protein|nr:hypothetical protein [Planctomicrobium sp.]MBT5018295.1 hypothetical protein [Planctomicrobium sp.]MDA7503592.1 hypothetical protein [bacterium]MDB4743290.1 hypothetical protein [Planctomicrobium sp.]